MSADDQMGVTALTTKSSARRSGRNRLVGLSRGAVALPAGILAFSWPSVSPGFSLTTTAQNNGLRKP